MMSSHHPKEMPEVQGQTAIVSMEAALGRGQEESAPMSRAQMYEYIMGAPESLPEREFSGQDYSDACRMIAKRLVKFLQRTKSATPSSLKAMNFSETMQFWKKADPEDYAAMIRDTQDPTGFMVGWAVNAVRYISEMPPTGNPALLRIEIESPEGDGE